MHRLIPVFVVFLFFSCSNKYRPFQSLYTFKSGDGKPDYRQLDYWAAHPWKQDPSDSVPAGLDRKSVV